nr:glycosyltransferase 87 family protein [Hyphomonas sp. Mor2]
MNAVPPTLRIGAGLTALVVGLAALSYAFPYGLDVKETPLALYIGLALILGGFWACLLRFLGRTEQASGSVLAVLLLGLMMRGAMFLSLPVLEDDSYRYLWDGAVTANGLDPYTYAPAEALPSSGPWAEQASSESDPDLARLQALAGAHAEPHSRINYPYVSTIYPPLAQAAFAAAHVIDPFGLTGWRLVLLAADLVSFWLLILLLRENRKDPIWSSLYWWNPVLILQAYGAGHMDLLLVPFLLAALWLAQRRKLAASSAALAGAAAVKLWPVLLFPLLVRPLLRQPIRLVAISVLFVGVLAIALLPQLLHALRPEAGLNAYASEWRTHAFLFAIFEDAVFAPFEASGTLARGFVAMMMLTLTGALTWRYADQPDRLPVLSAILISALIFLSPTGYPWYLIWLAPLVVFLPHPGLIALFVLAPLYWLRFPFGDDSILYQWGIVPIAFGLPLLLMAQSFTFRRSDDANRHHYPSPE